MDYEHIARLSGATGKDGGRADGIFAFTKDELEDFVVRLISDAATQIESSDGVSSARRILTHLSVTEQSAEGRKMPSIEALMIYQKLMVQAFQSQGDNAFAEAAEQLSLFTGKTVGADGEFLSS